MGGRVTRLVIAAAVALSLILVGLNAAPPAGAVPIDFMARTDGRTIVSVGPSESEPFTVIDVQPVNGASPTTIGSGNDFVGSPDVSGNLVVWSEAPGNLVNATYSNIREENLRTSSIVDVTSNQTNVFDDSPSISGSRVAWVRTISGASGQASYSLMTTDLKTSAAPVVVATTSSERYERPSISGNLIVWTQDGQSASDPSTLWGDYAGSAPFAIATGSGGNVVSGGDVGGSNVVYGLGSQVHLVNVAVPGSDRVISNDGDSPTTDGRYVFWHVELTNDGNLEDLIRGYDIETNSYIAPPALAEMNIEPWTRGGVLVWTNDTDIEAEAIQSFLPSAQQPNPGKTSPNWTFYPQTGHYLSYGFRDFWQTNGGLPIFGYPLTEEFDQGGLTVQYLERQRFEYHPNNPAPYQVELGLLGSEDAAARG